MANKKAAPKPKVKPAPKPRVKRSYRDHERVAAISLSEQVGPTEAARQLNIPIATIRCWAEGWRSVGALQMYQQGRGQLADIFEKAAWESINLARDKAHLAPYKDVVRGAALATDKMLVLRGQPTVITGNTNRNINVSVAELLKRATPEQLEMLLPILEDMSGASATVTHTLASAVGIGGTGADESAGVRPPVLVDAQPDV